MPRDPGTEEDQDDRDRDPRRRRTSDVLLAEKKSEGGERQHRPEPAETPLPVAIHHTIEMHRGCRSWPQDVPADTEDL